MGDKQLDDEDLGAELEGEKDDQGIVTPNDENPPVNLLVTNDNDILPVLQ